VDFDSHNVTRHDMRLLDSHRKKGKVVVNIEDDVDSDEQPEIKRQYFTMDDNKHLESQVSAFSIMSDVDDLD
jgi:hypothetical protein